jgi:protein TonB
MRRALLASLLLHAVLLCGLAAAWSPLPAVDAPLLISLQPAPALADARQPVAAHGTSAPRKPSTAQPGRALPMPPVKAANPAEPDSNKLPMPAAVSAAANPVAATPSVVATAAPATQAAPNTGRGVGETASQQVASSRPARVLQAPRPDYPVISRDLGEQGVVMLRLAIDADGTLLRTELQKSSGFTRLDRAARDGVTRWQFQAAQENGRPVAAQLVLPVRFSLDEN